MLYFLTQSAFLAALIQFFFFYLTEIKKKFHFTRPGLICSALLKKKKFMNFYRLNNFNIMKNSIYSIDNALKTCIMQKLFMVFSSSSEDKKKY